MMARYDSPKETIAEEICMHSCCDKIETTVTLYPIFPQCMKKKKNKQFYHNMQVY